MAEIRIEPGGPMTVTGAPLGRLVHAGDRWSVDPVATDPAYALCRCGRSSTMPFCDRVAEDRPCFEEPAADGPPPGPFRWDVPDPDGPPALALKPDGPVRVAGDVAIVYGDEPVPTDGRTSLCRCGRSRCQPLCDSSHKPAGFRG
jgi:CDGSH-type Zn-finger protein